MQASDVMTSPVVTVGPDTSVRVIAALLYERHISAVPVVEAGRVVGMVSEGDLLHRREIGTERSASSSSWWLRLFSADRSPAEYIKSHAKRARDIMTGEVTTVSPRTHMAEIATLLETRGIKRVPVLEGERLVGIVSRSDLVRAIARSARADRPETPIADEAIHKLLMAELERQSWWRPTVSNVTVTGGVVEFAGIIDSEDERDAARVAAETIPGVRRVEDRRHMMKFLSSMV